MKAKNVVLGLRVELKDVSAPVLLEGNIASRYELKAGHQGNVVALADEDGDVRVAFDEHTNPHSDNTPYMFVHPSRIRKVKE